MTANDTADHYPIIEKHADGQYVLIARQTLPLPPDELFPFFADAANLQKITPPFLSFEVLTPATEVHEGMDIDYRLKVHGIPMRWRSRITSWNPPHKFVDEQIKGPYRRWHHEHILEPTDAGGTTMIDRVTYAVPGGPLVHSLMVERDVRAIFTYRINQLAAMFGG